MQVTTLAFSQSLSFLSGHLTWHIHLIVFIESLRSQWRNTIQPQQMMLWTSQYSELLIKSNQK